MESEVIPRLLTSALGKCWCRSLRWGQGQKTRSILVSELKYLKVDIFIGIGRERKTGVIYHQQEMCVCNMCTLNLSESINQYQSEYF